MAKALRTETEISAEEMIAQHEISASSFMAPLAPVQPFGAQQQAFGAPPQPFGAPPQQFEAAPHQFGYNPMRCVGGSSHDQQDWNLATSAAWPPARPQLADHALANKHNRQTTAPATPRPADISNETIELMNSRWCEMKKALSAVDKFIAANQLPEPTQSRLGESLQALQRSQQSTESVFNSVAWVLKYKQVPDSSSKPASDEYAKSLCDHSKATMSRMWEDLQVFKAFSTQPKQPKA